MWCSTAMQQLHVNTDELTFTFGPRLSHHDQTQYQAYCALRELVTDHVASGRQPLLHETAHPTGGVNWLPEVNDNAIAAQLL